MRLAPHPFTLRQLQYAVAVADALSFRRAAEACHVSQPSLSAQLAQLEDALAVRLFERDRRRVLKTPAGQALVARARRILLDADDLIEAARRAGDPLAGTLRVGILPTISPYLLPSVAPPLRKAFPALTVAWVEDKTSTLVHALEEGELDAALLALEAELGDVEHAELARDPFVLATPPGHELGLRKTPATPAELRGAQVLLLDEGHCLREQALELCGASRARESELRATSLSTLTQMVAGGAGVTLLPELSLATEARRAGLELRPFAAPAPARTLALVWRRGSPLGGALRTIAEAMRRSWPTSSRTEPSSRPAPSRDRRRPRSSSRRGPS
jgi:LysR family transcriptional regulator, hydrogen peroxide-inducible genes activator